MVPRLVHPFCSIRSNFRTRLPFCCQSSHTVFDNHPLALGRTCRTASALSGSLALSSLACGYLPHRLHFTLESDHRVGWRKWHPARQVDDGKSTAAGHHCKYRFRALPFISNSLLVQRQRPLASMAMCCRRSTLCLPPCRRRPCSVPVPSLANLFVSLHNLSRVPRFPMGHPFVGNRISRDILCASHFVPALGEASVLASRGIATGFSETAAREVARPTFPNRPLASALAFVLPHVPIRMRQAAQWRPDLAHSHSP